MLLEDEEKFEEEETDSEESNDESPVERSRKCYRGRRRRN